MGSNSNRDFTKGERLARHVQRMLESNKSYKENLCPICHKPYCDDGLRPEPPELCQGHDDNVDILRPCMDNTCEYHDILFEQSCCRSENGEYAGKCLDEYGWDQMKQEQNND